MRTLLQPYVLAPIIGLAALLAIALPQYRGWQLPEDTLSYDEDLRLLDSSAPVRAGMVSAGDKIIALNGAGVSTPDELELEVARSRSPQAVVAIQSAALFRTLRLDHESLDNLIERDPDPILLQDTEDDGQARVAIDALRLLIDERPAGVVITWKQDERVIQGPVSLVPQPAPWLALNFLFAGLALVAAILFRQIHALESAERSRLTPALSALAGGASVGGLLLLSSQPYAAPGVLLWTLAALVPWWLMKSSRAKRRYNRRQGRVLLSSTAFAIFVVLWFAEQRGMDWAPGYDGEQDLLLGSLIVAGIAQLALALRAIKGEELSVERILAWICIAPWIAAPIWHLNTGASLITVFSAAAAFGIAPIWLHDSIRSSLKLESGSEHLLNRREGLEELLKRISADHAGAIGIAWGAAGQWMLLRWESLVGGYERSARLVQPNEDIASALTMLELEGGSLPSHGGFEEQERDPFLGLKFKEPLCAIFPVDLEDGALFQVFVILFGEGDLGEASTPDEINTVRGALDGISRLELLRELRELSAPTAASVSSDDSHAELYKQDPPIPELAARLIDSSAEHDDAPSGSPARQSDSLDLLENLNRIYDPFELASDLNDDDRAELQELADAQGHILITGEPGLAKETTARLIHSMSPLSSGRFIALNAAVNPPSILEAKLFGGADEPGIVELAREGTLALQSISSLPPARLKSLAAKLSRHSTRLIFVEHILDYPDTEPPQQLLDLVGDNQLTIEPLSDRPDELRRLAEHYLTLFSMVYGKLVASYAPGALERVIEWGAPANIPDLMEVIRQAVIRAEGSEITVEDLGLALGSAQHRAGQESLPISDLNDGGLTREELLDALKEAEGNKSEAARILGISRGKFLRRLDKLGIST